MRLSSWRSGWFLAGVVAVAAGVMYPAAAGAASTACPADPGAYVAPTPPLLAGDDAIVREIHLLRREQATRCLALADRLDVVVDRILTLNVNVADGRVYSDTLPAKLTALHSDLVGDVGVHIMSGHGVDPQAAALRTDGTYTADPESTQTVHLADGDQTWLQGNQTASRADVWFLIGLLCFAPFALLFLRVVLP